MSLFDKVIVDAGNDVLGIGNSASYAIPRDFYAETTISSFQFVQIHDPMTPAKMQSGQKIYMFWAASENDKGG